MTRSTPRKPASVVSTPATILAVTSCMYFATLGAGCSDRHGAEGGGSIDRPAGFDAGVDCCPDMDEDRICDGDEGRADLDRDGVPNREDLDADGDGVPDAREAGDDDTCTEPADHDDDGIPDYLDPGYPEPPPGSGLDGGVDMGVDSGPIVEELCAPEDRVDDACLEEDVEEDEADLCNGADDDCDGVVDEGCPCEPGTVQRCFRGPPGRRSVGACQDGTQTCSANGEFGGIWGPCTGGRIPTAEVCDDLDNDCNGCSDEVADCVPNGSCPGPDDPRVPEGAPFSSYELRGSDFYFGADAIEWRWEVEGTPCDEMFRNLPGSTATSTNGQLSYKLTGANSEDAMLEFTLSGDYRVTLTVVRADGTEFECSWIIRVRAPGLRVELCWDATGPTADAFGGTVDLDLHLGQHGRTARWFDQQDCHFANCKSGSSPLNWYYEDTSIENCTGPGARGGFSGSCPNPRLDIDNISTSSSYVPENINVDNPRDGDEFRVMVHHYTSTTRVVHPIVNVYCGGELSGSFGASPDEVEGFDEGGGSRGGDMWKVADVTMNVDDETRETLGCDVAPIHPPLEMGGYWITTDDPTF